jgi:excisionase family DNA binding protein
MSALPAVYTVEEAARVLRVGRAAMYDAVRAGQVPGVIRIGRSIRISRAALEQQLGLQNADGPQSPSSRPPNPTSQPREERIDDEGS